MKAILATRTAAADCSLLVDLFNDPANVEGIIRTLLALSFLFSLQEETEAKILFIKAATAVCCEEEHFKDFKKQFPGVFDDNIPTAN